ncbi:hypothetical protein OY671_012258, partial [Metschnikowia pulcherrima]
PRLERPRHHRHLGVQRAGAKASRPGQQPGARGRAAACPSVARVERRPDGRHPAVLRRNSGAGVCAGAGPVSGRRGRDALDGARHRDHRLGDCDHRGVSQGACSPDSRGPRWQRRSPVARDRVRRGGSRAAVRR